MIKIIEHQGEIGLKGNDQSRIIEYDSFNQYINDLKNNCTKYNSLPDQANIENLRINNKEELLVLEFIHPYLEKRIIHTAEVNKC